MVCDSLQAGEPERAALLGEYAGLLAQFEAHVQASPSAETWAYAFAVKARLFLALLDRARAREHLARGQAWLDLLCPEETPMVFRNVGGVKVVTRGDASRPEIALTFDGGPSADTPALLDFLAQEGVKATFFMLGCFAQKDPATARRIAAEGHVVANHTMTHARWKGLARISAQAGALDIEEGFKVIGAAAGVTDMDLFRPPYGSGAELEWVNRLIARYHRYSIMWTIDTLDSMGAGIEKQIRRVLTSSRLNGAIILTHDHSKHILTLVRTIVPELKRRGFRFVTVPELLVAAESRICGEQLGELCVALQEGRVAEACAGAQRVAGAARHDRLALELMDLAYVAARLYPGLTGAADPVRTSMLQTYPADLLPWSPSSR